MVIYGKYSIIRNDFLDSSYSILCIVSVSMCVDIAIIINHGTFFCYTVLQSI